MEQQQVIEAAAGGKVEKLEEILQKDPFSLYRFLVGRFNWTPLHVAAAHDRNNFVSRVLHDTPELIDLLDSRNRTALHLASAKGHIRSAEILAFKSPDLCLSRDIDGRNPLHLAAMGGHTEVMKILVGHCPHAARVAADHGETILHLCVKVRKAEALKLLVESVVGDDEQLLNARDGNGNTILHLAASCHNWELTQMFSYLLQNKKVKVNVMNMGGKTVLDIVKKIPKENVENNMSSIKRNLIDRGALTGKDMARGEWLSKQQESLMIVASLIATMAFQAGVSPPGGVWQDDKDDHRAGEAVLAYNYPDTYPLFLRANTTGFVVSLSTILLLISGLPFRRRSHMWILVVIMWVTITAMAVTYAFSIVSITPKKGRDPMRKTMYVAIPVWGFVMVLLLLFHTFRLFMKMRKEEKGRKWTSS